MYALYARQSVDKKDSISVESQIEYCKYELRGQDYQEYIDKGFSGKNTNRPSFENMFNDIKQGKVEKVVVYKLDRISRSILDFSAMMEAFQTYNVEFISSTEKFDTSTPIGRAMLNICVVFAQLERETIQKRVADTYYARSKKGFYMGGRTPYGFGIEKTIIDGIKTSKYVPIEEECEQIRLMYKLYADPTNSLGDIVRYFHENGIKHRRSGVWSTARLSEMLRNPIYVKADADVYDFYKNQGSNIMNDVSDFVGLNGCYLYKGETANKKQYSLSDKHVVLAPHEGVVSSEQWIKCRMKCLNNRQSTMTCKGKNSWLVGKVKCKKCGYALVVKKSNTRMGRYFICSSKSLMKNCEGAGTVYAQVLEDFMLHEIKNKLLEFTTLTNKKEKARNPKLNSNKLKIAQIENEISALLDKVGNANEILMKYINEKIEGLDGERKRLQEETLMLACGSAKDNIDKISNYIDKWEETEFEDKQLVVDALIKFIKITDENIEIIWKV